MDDESDADFGVYRTFEPVTRPVTGDARGDLVAVRRQAAAAL